MDEDVPDLVGGDDAYDESGDDSDGWEECMDEEDEGTALTSPCLFCSEQFKSAELIYSHCESKHRVNFSQAAHRLQLDCFSYIKLVNFIRQKKTNVSEFNDLVSSGQTPWDSDDFMKPTIAEDVLLQYDIEDILPTAAELQPSNDCQFIGSVDPAICPALAAPQQLLSRVREVESRATQAEERLQQALADLDKMRLAAQNLVSVQNTTVPSSEKAIENLRDDEDDAYFDSYGHFNIHQEMLQDKVRTESYRDSIYQNKELFRDKVVLDIGCGTGILSMMAARAGAKQVIGVEMSDIIYQAIDIIKENGLGDSITLIKGRMEDVKLPVEKVDVIISEWMGYLLLFESMLDTVLWARDKYLAPDGVLLPNKSNIFLAALDDEEMHKMNYAYWDDVYGFKMSCLREEVLKEAAVEIVKSSKVASVPCLVKELDICSCSTKDLEFSSSFSLPVTRSANINAIVAYFDIHFSLGSNKIYFSTAPDHTPTHWKQTVFRIDKPISVVEGDKIDGEFVCRKNRRDPRSLIVDINIGGKKRTYTVQ